MPCQKQNKDLIAMQRLKCRQEQRAGLCNNSDKKSTFPELWGRTKINVVDAERQAFPLKIFRVIGTCILFSNIC